MTDRPGTKVTDTKQHSPRKPKVTSPDALVRTGKTGKVELSEDELKDVSGGYQTGGSGHVKID